MKRSAIARQDVMTMCGTAAFGAVAGVLLVAFASVISSSLYTAAATVLIASSIGWCVGRVPGAFAGGLTGILLAAFGSVVGTTFVGASAAVVGCMVLAVLLDSQFEQLVYGPVSPNWYQPQEVDPWLDLDFATPTLEFETLRRIHRDRVPPWTPRWSPWHDRFVARGLP